MAYEREYMVFMYYHPKTGELQWKRYVPITGKNRNYVFKLMKYATEEGWNMYDARTEWLTDGHMMQQLLDDPMVTISHIDINVVKKIEKHANNRPEDYESMTENMEYYEENKYLLPLHKFYASKEVFLKDSSNRVFFEVAQGRYEDYVRS